MKQALSRLALSLALLFSVSCYHARIETGLPVSTQVIDKPFASGWIYGLVPPSVVNTAKDCANGVAIVETEHSFVNQLVGFLTLGIYTPIHIKVTCASSAKMGASNAPADQLLVARTASEQEVVEAFALAAQRAVEQNQAVYVQFE